MEPEMKMTGTLRYFFLAFSIAFLGFSLLFLAFTNMSSVKPAPVIYTHPEEVYSPEPGDSLTVLAMGTPGKGDLPGMYVLARFNPAAGEIPFTLLTPDTLITNNGKRESLSEVYKYGGASYTRDSLAEELGIVIDRYVRIDQKGFITAIDAVGSMEYYLEEDYDLEQNGISMVLRSGIQLLDGKKTAALLSRPHRGGDERLQRAGKLIEAYINQRIDIFLSIAADGVFGKVINLVDTDIAYTDYHIRKEAAAYLAGSGREVAVYIPITVTGGDSGFELTDTLKARLAGIFG